MKPESQELTSGIPLRLATILPLVLLVIAVAVIVGYLALNAATQNANRLIAEQQDEVTTRIVASLDDYLEMPHLLNRLTVQLLAGDAVPLEDLSRWRLPLLKKLQVFESVNSCGFGTADGEFVAVGRGDDSTYTTAIFDRSFDDSYLVQELSADGTAGQITTSVPDYDARSRGWFQTGQSAAGPAWSPIYVWASQQNIGISAVLAVRNAAGDLTTVQLAALSLDGLSHFLADLPFSRTGYAFIVEQSGDLVATSTGDALVQRADGGDNLVRVSAEGATTPVIRAAATALAAKPTCPNTVPEASPSTFILDGERYLFQTTPYTNPYGLNWLIVTVVAEDTITGPLARSTRTTIGFSLVAVMVAIAIGTLTTNWLTRPIEQLNASARELAQGNWSVRIRAGPVREVNQLTAAFQSMADQLQNAFDHLEQRVAARTTSLAEANAQLQSEVAERKRIANDLRRSEASYRAAQQVGHVGSWEYNVQTTEFWGSDEAKRIYGLDPAADSFSTEQVERCIPERERVHRALVDLIEKDTPYDLIFEIHPYNSDTPRFISSVAQLTRDQAGQPAQVVGVIADVTERYRARQAVRRLNAELEQRVADRTAELEEAQAQLMRRERLAALGQIAGGIGHELRNPLGVISNAATYLRMTSAEADEVTQEYLDIISTEVRTAGQIISDLLDLSRSQALHLSERAPHAIGDLITEALGAAPAPPDVTVTNTVADDLPHVLVNAQQLHQVLTNVITNSYQAMPEGGAITFSADVTPNGAVRIDIADTGRGIAEADLNRIFEPLFTTKPHGIGLGLTICRALIEANDGTIEISSAVGVGTTVHLTLPVAPDPEPSQPGQADKD